MNEYRQRLWAAIKAGTVTVDQLCAVDEATAKLLPYGDVLCSARNWALTQKAKRIPKGKRTKKAPGFASTATAH